MAEATRHCANCRKDKSYKDFDVYGRGNTRRRWKICRQCASLYNIPEDRGLPEIDQKEHRYPKFETVWTPHNEFPRGGRFLHSKFAMTLKDGIWPLGMIVRHTAADTLHVVCGIARAYIDPPEDLPRQWLVQIESTNRGIR